MQLLPHHILWSSNASAKRVLMEGQGCSPSHSPFYVKQIHVLENQPLFMTIGGSTSNPKLAVVMVACILVTSLKVTPEAVAFFQCHRPDIWECYQKGIKVSICFTERMTQIWIESF